MNAQQFNLHRLTAISAVLVLALVQHVSISGATTNPPQRPALPNVNLDGELRALDSFLDEWLKLHKQQLALSKKRSITNVEFTTFRSSAEGLKNRCSEFQTAIRELIRKLKDAGRWNGLDDEVLARTNNQRLKSNVREGGGAKRIFEDASSQFCSQAESEISDPIDRLRPKLGAQVQESLFDQTAQTSQLHMVRVSYHPDPPTLKYAFRCTGSIIRILARMAVGKDTTSGKAYENWECFCMEECGTASAT